jgi:hypothetical protein
VALGSAFVSSLFVSPFVYVIDRSLIASSSGSESFMKNFNNGMRIVFTKPWQLFFKEHRRAFMWMWGLYGATYIVSNGLTRILKYTPTPPDPNISPLGGHLIRKERKESSVSDTGTLIRFGGTALTNVTMCALKDKVYTELFSHSPVRRIPSSVMSLFILRDSITVVSSFNLPDYFAAKVYQKDIGLSYKQCVFMSQFLTPATAQFLSAPIHILALDFHIFPHRTWVERWENIRVQYWKTSLARAARIFPAFGIGGVCNRALERQGMDYIYRCDEDCLGCEEDKRLESN